MKEPYGEGLASHTGPEPCTGDREETGEDLAGAHTGRVSSCEINLSGTPTLFTKAEGNTEHGDMRESCGGSAQSKTLSMHGSSTYGNREIPKISVQNGRAGQPEKAKRRMSGMHPFGKPGGCIVPKKPSNKSNVPVEVVEG